MNNAQFKAGHTPAPWSINEWPQADSNISIGAIGTPLIAKAMSRDTSINEQKANALLIAAAPELLAMLETLAWHAGHYASMPHAHSDAHKDVANAYAIIKKAKGLQ